ncbi:MAG: hypothetical protein LBF24_00575, partial [Puniceicoccales bacterium]|nr:hypothetical protein [Puniceicoccales bacterium]
MGGWAAFCRRRAFYALPILFSCFATAALGGLITVGSTEPAQNGISSALNRAGYGDVLIFSSKDYPFEGDSEISIAEELIQNIIFFGNGARLIKKSDYAERFFCFTGQCMNSLDGISFCCESNTPAIESDGGAIYSQEGFFDCDNGKSISNCSFIQNLTRLRGGAIASYDSFAGAVAGVFAGVIENSQFSSNGAVGDGGAIFCCEDFSGSIQGSTFIDNFVDEANDTYFSSRGGAISCGGNFTGTIQQSIFARNRSAESDNPEYFQCGGALYCANNLSGNVTGSVFAKNYAANSGGAIYCNGDLATDEGACVDLGGSYFLGNTAGVFGGAIYCRTNARFEARSGDVIFQGNSPGGLHFANKGDEKVVAIGATEGRTFWCYDSIGGNIAVEEDPKFNVNLTIQINPEPDQTGTVLFDTRQQGIWFEGESGTTVFNGTMALQNGASFGGKCETYPVFHDQPNAGIFTLCESATLRIAYGQDIQIYSFDESTLQVKSQTQSMPYDPQDPVCSEIVAGAVNLLGKLHFVLPPNVTENAVILKIPNGEVTVASSATIDVGINSCTSESFALCEGQSVVLLECQSLQLHTNFPNCDGETIPGVRSDYQFRIQQDGNRILAEFLSTAENSSGGDSSSFYDSSSANSGSDSSANSGFGSSANSGFGSSTSDISSSSGESGVTDDPRKALCGGWLVGVALLNGSGDRLEISQIGKTTAFCTVGGGAERCEVGSAIELRENSLVAGLVGRSGPFTFGPFLEGAATKSDTENLVDGELERSGSGQAQLLGGGLFLRLDLPQMGSGRIFGEIIGRAGILNNRWDGEDEAADMSFSGSKMPYFGGRAGLGCRWRDPWGYAMEFYGRYSWSHLNETDLQEETFSFRPVDSHRARLGYSMVYPSDKMLAPWFGGYYEWELAGTAKLDQGEVPWSSLRGKRFVGELGLTVR